MRNFIVTTLAMGVFLATSTSISNSADNAADIDMKLVGDWQGQRDPGSKCSFLARRMG